MLDSVQILMQEATSEENIETALAQLRDISNAAYSIKSQLVTMQEESANTCTITSTNKQLDSLEVFESLIETLIEMDEDNEHDVQNIASTFIELKNLLENSNDDSVSDIKQQLDELYKVALSIESKLKSEE